MIEDTINGRELLNKEILKDTKLFCEVEGSSETSALTPTVFLVATFPVSFKTTCITTKSNKKIQTGKKGPIVPEPCNHAVPVTARIGGLS